MIDSFKKIIQKGKVNEFACFPYSGEFMKESRKLGIASRQVNYLNLWEDSLLDSGISNGDIALRPFFASKHKEMTKDELEKLNTIKKGDVIFHCLNYVLSHPKVSSVVVGMNSVEQLSNILLHNKRISKNKNTFNSYRAVFSLEPVEDSPG
ncbi:MAG: hypothetical protein ABNH03_16380 [Alteromonas sp.]|jgi:aryl-alcohol dehydrogenase-like predicted oxidoreductase|uniref:hypothetical protein n=1 Tax=Alteromonas sp. TaxID=232 RepID=UPI0030CDF3A4|tara:strand:+ start:227 stop:679 length:453 start_codon:yes stop_codon:yes gene_type:complete